MSETTAPPDPAPAAHPPVAQQPATGSPEAMADVRAAVVLVVVLLVLGAALGPLWAWWSPAGPAAVFPGGGVTWPVEESEAWIQADGRFLVIAAVVGLLAGVLAYLRGGNRGAIVGVALGVGGVGGAFLMDWTGYLTGGGSEHGSRKVQLTDGSIVPYTAHLPISVHATGVLVVEAALAVLVYAILVGFAARDDLGRPDPVRDRLRPPPPVFAGPGYPGAYPPPAPGTSFPPGTSVDAGGYPQYGGGDGDAPRAPQQGQLPPQ